LEGSPVAERVKVLPYGVVVGSAEAVKEVAA